jgi:rubrerythrin
MIKKHNIDFFTPIAKISTKAWIKRKFLNLIKQPRSHSTSLISSQSDVAKRHEEFFKQLIHEIGGKDKFIQETKLFYNYSYTELTNITNINISARFIDFIITTLPHNIPQTHKLYKQLIEFHTLP